MATFPRLLSIGFNYRRPRPVVGLLSQSCRPLSSAARVQVHRPVVDQYPQKIKWENKNPEARPAEYDLCANLRERITRNPNDRWIAGLIKQSCTSVNIPRQVDEELKWIIASFQRAAEDPRCSRSVTKSRLAVRHRARKVSAAFGDGAALEFLGKEILSDAESRGALCGFIFQQARLFKSYPAVGPDSGSKNAIPGDYGKQVSSPRSKVDRSYVPTPLTMVDSTLWRVEVGAK
ncbi:hypothetical protein KM043_008257 [Ampulex compressa]|nr:hypothetical protein KM043_008257 [Ampulex compressa]